ncbi:hypothetical protein TH62_07400 [Bacillus sp. TH008]|nr:hypothetical protein TH62_07400 [Bacillus sp. TH008]
MPYETRQPSTTVEMVPIHAKRHALKDERKAATFNSLSAHVCRKAFFINMIGPRRIEQESR